MACVCLTLLAAMLPHGGVAPDARAVVVILTLCACLLCLTLPHRPAIERVPALALALLAISAVMRQIALPIDTATQLAPGLRPVASVLRDAGDRVTLAYEPFLERSRLGMYLAYALLAYTGASLARSRWRRLFMRALASIGTFQAVAGIIGTSGWFWYADSSFGGVRANGTFSGGNSFGGFMAISLISTTAYLMAMAPRAIAQWRRHWRILLHTNDPQVYRMIELPLLLLSLVAQSAALLLSGSRGGVVSTLIALLILAVWYIGSQRSRQRDEPVGWTLVTPLMGVIGIGFGGTFVVFYRRLASAFSDPGQVSFPRTDIWLRTLEMIRDHPFGVGFGAFYTAFPRYARIAGDVRVDHAHNDYLELVAEGGIGAGIAAAFLIVWFFTRLLTEPSSNKEAVHERWLRRGLAMAVLAGLLHAMVDFNLSARPGVGCLFFIVAGLSGGLSVSLNATPPYPLAAQRMRGFAIAVAILAAVSLVVPDVFRHAGAYRDIERGFTAGGGASHLYRWWPVSRVAADRAVAVAERAIRRAPRHAWSHVMLGRVRLLDIARRRQATERQLRESHQHLPEPSLRGMVSAVLADDCLAATQAAIEDCRRAIRIAPLEPFHYAYTIRSIGVLIPLLYDPDERDAVLNRLLWAVDAAVMLAPTDTTWVLLPAIQTLAGIAVDTPESDVWKPVLKDRVHDLGIRLMRLHGESVNRVAEVFMALDIDLSTALPASGIPLMQLRGLYAYCLRQGDFSAAQSIIERILGKIDNPEIPLGAIDPRDETAAHREALRVQMACARVRLLLLQGRIATLGDTHPDVREARRLLVDEQLMQSGQETLPTTSMARVHRSHGLPEDRFLQWIRLLLVAGDHAVVDTQMIRHLLAAWDRGEIIPWDQVNRIVRDLPHDAAAGLLVEAMLAMEAHRYPAVVDAIRRLLDAQGLPVAARPLVQVLLADSYQGSGNVAARDIALRRALAAAPRLSAAWTRVKAWDVALPHASGGAMASEDVMLPLTFLGGAIEVVGFTFDEYRMSISVTFRGPVPSDLTMAVAVYDADGQWLGGARHAFARSHAATFASGNPAWGDRYRIERSLRTFGSPPDRLVVGFRSSREPTPIITSYGQRSIDIRGLSRTLTVP